MENLNAEQIKKALECCLVICYCNTCPYYKIGEHTQVCTRKMAKDALTLINSQEQRIGELTEENERLRAEVNKLDALSDEMGVDIDVKLKTIFELEDKLKAEKADVMYFKDQIRAATVRKMQERLKSEIAKYFLPTFQFQANAFIDQIAKEMIGDAE